jgi:hypothetical protein
MRIIAFWSLNKNSASDLASCVFHTQVLHAKINDQIGRLGSANQALDLLIALLTVSIA